MATKKEKLRAVAQRWDAAKHPRYPAGHPQGGKFMPKESPEYKAAIGNAEDPSRVTGSAKLKAIAKKISKSSAKEDQPAELTSGGFVKAELKNPAIIEEDPYNLETGIYAKAKGFREEKARHEREVEKASEGDSDREKRETALRGQRLMGFVEEALAEVPSDAAELFNRIGYPDASSLIRGSGSYIRFHRSADEGNSAIHIEPGSIDEAALDSSPNFKRKARRYVQEVYIHEWGHHLDSSIGENYYDKYDVESGMVGKIDGKYRSAFSEEPLSVEALEQDADGFGREEYRQKNAEVLDIRFSVAKRIGLTKRSPTPEETEHFRYIEDVVADMAASLSRGKVGYGHSSEYFSSDEKRVTEMFAHFVTCVSSPYEEFRQIPEKLSPTLWRLWKDRVKERVGIDFDGGRR